MASSSSPNNSSKSNHFGFEPNSIPNTTFVQADPTTFRAIVQSLTGAPKPAFKLHERRPKMKIKLDGGAATLPHSVSSSARNRENYMVMASPLSPLDYMAARESPKEENFYLHPSPFSTPRGSDPPELLPLFPLHSPVENHHSSF